MIPQTENWFFIHIRYWDFNKKIIIRYYQTDTVFKVMLQSIIDLSLSFPIFLNSIMIFIYFGSIKNFLKCDTKKLIIKIHL